MTQSFQGTTLALQHYYDIITVSRKMPLLTVYQANEQPFGQRMTVWMAEYSQNPAIPSETKKRLDDALQKNRSIPDKHILSILDYGTTDGNRFVITDELRQDDISLKSFLSAHGPLQPWQTLRILEQLVELVIHAHQADFTDLCLSSDTIFIRDQKRLDIVTGPLGIGLHRSDILEMKDVPVKIDMIKHIPPWEYTDTNALEKRSQTEHNLKNQKKNSSSESKTDNNDDKKDDSTQTSENENQDDNSQLDEEIQDLDASPESVVLQPEIPTPPQDLCPDMYNIAAIAYESLCGMHPYFNDNRDLIDAALTIVQGNAVDLSKRADVSQELSDVVMNALKTPTKDSEKSFLNLFSEQCTEDDRTKVLQADKIYHTLTQGPTPKPTQRPQNTYSKLNPFIIVVSIILVIAAIFITYSVTRLEKPVDLFAIPEITPSMPNGVDIVITTYAAPPNLTLYLTSLDDGSLIRLGTVPYIYRNQQPGAKLNFVIADNSAHTMQIPITVSKNENNLMIVPIDVNW